MSLNELLCIANANPTYSEVQKSLKLVSVHRGWVFGVTHTNVGEDELSESLDRYKKDFKIF